MSAIDDGIMLNAVRTVRNKLMGPSGSNDSAEPSVAQIVAMLTKEHFPVRAYVEPVCHPLARSTERILLACAESDAGPCLPDFSWPEIWPRQFL